MVNLNFILPENSDLKEGLGLVSQVRGFKLSDSGLRVYVDSGSDGFSIIADGDCAKIEYCGKSDFYHAVAILVGQLERNRQEFRLVEHRQIEWCGCQIDCSRNAVMLPHRVCEFMARMALAGMNCLDLYMEDVYEMKEYPYFGYLRGRYSEFELKQIDSVGNQLGIKVIPHIQTLAHLKTTLRWDYAREMKDNEDILLIDEPKTYEFIECMFQTMRSCFSSDTIHIGLDEAYYVGLGTYLRKHGYVNRFELISRHLGKVCEISRNYGFIPMVDGDMFLRLGSKIADNFDMDAEIPDNLPEMLPEDITVIYWDYYHTKKEEYLSLIDKYRKLNREILFYGGIWNWWGMGVNYPQTFRTMIPALSACSDTGITKVIAGTFGDDGGEVTPFATLLGIQLFAEYIYRDKVTQEYVMSQFDLCTGMDSRSFLALSIDSIPDNISGANRLTGGITYGIPLSRTVLYQDVLTGLFDKNISQFELEPFYAEIKSKLENVPVPSGFEEMFSYYLSMVEVLQRKSNIGIGLRKAYKTGDSKMLLSIAHELRELIYYYVMFHRNAHKYWHEYNKAFGYDKFDMRIGGTIARIQTAERKVRQYITGEIDRIEELEEELMYYRGESTKGKLGAVHYYSDISSVGHYF